MARTHKKLSVQRRFADASQRQMQRSSWHDARAATRLASALIDRGNCCVFDTEQAGQGKETRVEVLEGEHSVHCVHTVHTVYYKYIGLYTPVYILKVEQSFDCLYFL